MVGKIVYWVFTFCVFVSLVLNGDGVVSVNTYIMLGLTFGWVYLTGILIIVKSIAMIKGKKAVGVMLLIVGLLVIIFGYYIGSAILFPFFNV